MANRSYLYSVHEAEAPELRDLAEWSYTVPLVHWLLVGFDTRVVPTQLWDHGSATAIVGSGPPARELVLRVFDWLGPRLPAAESALAEARAMLTRPDRLGDAYRLEPGEIYAMNASTLQAMEDQAIEDLKMIRAIVGEMKTLLDTPESTLADAKHWALTDAFSDWERDLGLHFSEMLCAHLG